MEAISACVSRPKDRAGPDVSEALRESLASLRFES